MKKVGEWWLPDTEQLGLKWFENPRGERPEVIDAALWYVEDAKEKVALDVGAHVGTWAIELVKHFHHVHAFEPCVHTWIALAQNAGERMNIETCNLTLWLAAAGDKMTNCRPKYMANGTMSSHVVPDMRGGIPMLALDDIHWGRVGLIKLDIEGMEYFALKGAHRTIAAHHPVLAIEWKETRLNMHGDYARKMETMLTQWGYVLERQMEIDRIYV